MDSRVDYQAAFTDAVEKVKSEGRYRVFADLKRIRGEFPRATWTSPEGERDVTVWCSNDFLGQGQNTAQAFVTLKDWSERPRSDSAEAIVADINRTFAPLRDGRVSALQPPPIDNLGNSSGFSFRLQDRGQRGYAALMRARDQVLAPRAQNNIFSLCA